jgi:AcrR family transcriptional regulator
MECVGTDPVDTERTAMDLRADAARNRAQVIKVARQLLAAGDLTLQLNAIAKLAGVGVGTVYRHFPTRQALLEALVADAFAELIDVSRAAAAEPDPADGLELLLRRTFRILASSPGLTAVLESSALQCHETMELAAAFGEATNAILGRARQAGVIRPDLEADDIRRLICGMQHALDVGGDALDKLDLYLQVLLAGLRSRGR